MIHHDQIELIPGIQVCVNIQKLVHINEIKDNNYMIISVDPETAFDKIQRLIMIKPHSKTRNKKGSSLIW